MRKNELYPTHQDFFEYYGNTEIARIRTRGGKVVRQDWIIFNTVEEALDYFNTRCGEFVGHYTH